MTGEFIGLVAVVLTLGIPVAGMYTYYHVRKLRSQERLAAMARGVEIPMVAELSESARSRRAGILLCSGALGFIAALGDGPVSLVGMSQGGVQPSPRPGSFWRSARSRPSSWPRPMSRRSNRSFRSEAQDIRPPKYSRRSGLP